MKEKKNLIIMGLIVLILIVAITVIFFIKSNKKEKEIDANSQNETSIVKGQEEVTDLIKGYVDGNIVEIKEYAKNNSKVEFTIKELKGIFNIDTKNFDELKYGCSQDDTFIKLDSSYQDYTIVLGCSAFYIN